VFKRLVLSKVLISIWTLQAKAGSTAL